MLTIIESGANAWMAITVEGELRIYARAEAGEWGELSLSEDSEQVDPEKSFMLEELYARQSDQEEEGDEEELEGEEEPEAEEEEPEEEEEPDEEEPELEDEESEDSEDEEPEEEEKPRRRRAATAKNGRSTAGRK